MSKSPERVAVTSRSFSKHQILRAELEARYAHITFNSEGKSLAGEELVRFLSGHSKAITALEVIDEALLSRLPELKVLGKFGVGIDMIDLKALERRGVLFGWEGGTNKRSVSELVIALALSCLRHVAPSNQELRAGIWKQAKGQCLSGKTVGLVGCGHVGKDLVGLLKPFGCAVLCFDNRKDDFYAANDVVQTDLDDLLRRSDIVSIHLPCTDSTRGILNAARLGVMKPGAVLINTARGQLVDEAALKELLKSQKIAAAGFDVFAIEPPQDAELLNLPNFLATPHIGGSTEEAILAMGRAAINGLDHARPAREFLP